jgi:glycosyltransferase involved in cell wall biosynthesis
MGPDAARRPAILLVGYALTAGGGETFPIFLANELRRRNWPVSFLDCALEEGEPAIRNLLRANVPLYQMADQADVGPLCCRLGTEVVHSCHATTDLLVSRGLALLPKDSRPRHVVTLHGMYETLNLDSLLVHLSQVKAVDQFVYTASKNLSSFPKQFREASRFTRIPNALPVTTTVSRDRSELGLGTDGVTVAMLISRAIPEKGWQVAVEAVEDARVASGRDIHLVLIGNGPIYDEMRAMSVPPWLHLLGVQGDIRSWIAVADVGLLPSTFAGESYPLVLIDFLTMGVPVITSAAGEIPQMMACELGSPGFIVDETDPIQIREQMTEHLTAFVTLDAHDREALRERARAASAKFSFDDMVDAYEQVYEHICSRP